MTYALIAVNLAVFLVELGQPDPQVYLRESIKWKIPTFELTATLPASARQRISSA
ncbi:hypothetical protein [Candidatus Nephthysia bennettiae]|uniref:Uncharacterized protein n=1 Tax=Candidatus Nephthysia bennettiae TaxID=3127016 RepID=A0A934KAB1_9BACT|nr:hypothetical protein [Candidatus Dormibacteraeota bacterium]